MASLGFLFLDDDGAALTQAALADALRADWPDLTVTLEEQEEADGPVVLDVDGSMVALMTAPGQVGDDLAAIAQHSRLWPAAQEVPVDYSHHVIVTVFTPGEDGHARAVADAVMLSQVIASAVAVAGGIRAVYLGSANHVIVPELFRELAQSMLPEPLLPVWVALNVGPRPDGVMTGHTRGLDMLGLMDVEIPETPEDDASTLDRLAGISDYLLRQGPVIGDGDTIGATAQAEIVVRHAPSAFDPEATVLRLTFGSAPVAKKGLFSKFRR